MGVPDAEVVLTEEENPRQGYQNPLVAGKPSVVGRTAATAGTRVGRRRWWTTKPFVTQLQRATKC